jgi:undecaprenyl-diphosphatase
MSAPASDMPTQRLPLPVTIAVGLLLLISLVLAIPARPDWWKAIIMGIVQGLTEFLPISSTGHLLVAGDLLNYDGIGGTFEIFIQLGTVVSVAGYYFADLWKQARAVFGQAEPDETAAARRLWLGVLIAFIPAAIVGLTFRDFIKTVLFDTPQVIATALIVGGMVFLVIEWWMPRREAQATTLEGISFKQALAIGVAQVFALIPGTSRSGSSIVGGLLAGLDRRTATAFSFYLSIPTLGAATMVDLLGSLDRIQPDDWGRLMLGAVVSMIVGWWSIGWLLRYISRHSFASFGYYRIGAGIVILALVAAGIL